MGVTTYCMIILRAGQTFFTLRMHEMMIIFPTGASYCVYKDCSNCDLIAYIISHFHMYTVECSTVSHAGGWYYTLQLAFVHLNLSE